MFLTKLLNWIFGGSEVLGNLLAISGIAITNIIGVFFLESISSPYPDGYLGIIIASVIIICIFYVLVPRYTQEGKVQLAKAQGLKMYLTTAEKERFELLYPPQDSIERFEQLLPYALALGVGKTWANRFASYLKETGQQAIYFGSAHDWVTLSAMSKSCGLMNSPPLLLAHREAGLPLAQAHLGVGLPAAAVVLVAVAAGKVFRLHDSNAPIFITGHFLLPIYLFGLR